MRRLAQNVMTSMVVGGILVVCVGLLATLRSAPLRAAEKEAAEAPEPAPPADQTYVGSKECASCHFKQFMSWKKTKHSKTFDLLPEKYQTDETCLKCHTTGYGEPSGFKDMATTKTLAGTTCERCHGPGSKHAEICKGYGQKKLDAAEEKIARDSIWKLLPHNVCIECHNVQKHEKPATPKELITK